MLKILLVHIPNRIGMYLYAFTSGKKKMGLSQILYALL
jgi:hypothetical protein